MLIKKSLYLSGHSTSLALEKPFWLILEQEAEAKQISLNALIALIDQTRTHSERLASKCRIYALECVMKK